MIFMAGHGGDEFLKFQVSCFMAIESSNFNLLCILQDKEEISSQDYADAFQQMHKQKRYSSLFQSHLMFFLIPFLCVAFDLGKVS